MGIINIKIFKYVLFFTRRERTINIMKQQKNKIRSSYDATRKNLRGLVWWICVCNDKILEIFTWSSL